jgi:N-dimethylarginine dimethylaminohydrolase
MTPKYDKPTILMCPTDYFGIEYEINPWMSRSRQVDRDRAQEQWKSLRDLLESLGADVRLQPAVKGLPDLVFTANAGLVWNETVFLVRFRYEARQEETPLDDDWFRQNGFTTVTLPEGEDFEGAGDALFCGKTLFAGYLVHPTKAYLAV